LNESTKCVGEREKKENRQKEERVRDRGKRQKQSVVRTKEIV
jgi:hypothetical protein